MKGALAIFYVLLVERLRGLLALSNHYVDDVVRANMAAISGSLEQPMINVCTGIGTSTYALAKEIADIAGAKTEIGFGPRRPGDVERSVLDPGSPPPLGEAVSLEVGLRATVDSFRS